MKPFGVVKGIRRRLGIRGETTAARLLEMHGCRILCRNYRCRAGELDLVALDGEILRFVEVKSLRRKAGFTPAGNLSLRQRRRNWAAARIYRRITGAQRMEARFDLVEVVFDRGAIAEVRRHADYLPALMPETGEAQP